MIREGQLKLHAVLDEDRHHARRTLTHALVPAFALHSNF